MKKVQSLRLTSLFIPLLLFTFLSNPPSAQSKPRLLAYYLYADQLATPPYSSANIPMNKLTHIAHAFIKLDDSKKDGSVTFDPKFPEPDLITRAHAAGVKVLVSIGGSGDTKDSTFRVIAGNPNYRKNLADNLYRFVVANHYDGVDIDWEFPGAKGAFPEDKKNFNRLMATIRQKLPSP